MAFNRNLEVNNQHTAAAKSRAAGTRLFRLVSGILYYMHINLPRTAPIISGCRILPMAYPGRNKYGQDRADSQNRINVEAEYPIL
jgi:hypothetical protein